jgi:uncharacterized protein DUF6883
LGTVRSLIRVAPTLERACDPPRLPRAREAIIPPEKLAGYALDPMHPRGRLKARVFSAAPAIEQDDWRYLLEQLLECVLAAPVTGTRITPFGALDEVVVLVDGLNGATMPVATIGIVEGDLPPRLVSTWVDIHESLHVPSGLPLPFAAMRCSSTRTTSLPSPP